MEQSLVEMAVIFTYLPFHMIYFKFVRGKKVFFIRLFKKRKVIIIIIYLLLTRVSKFLTVVYLM